MTDQQERLRRGNLAATPDIGEIPQSGTAEARALACVFATPERAGEMLSELDADLLNDIRHQAILAAMKAAHRDGAAVDEATVYERLPADCYRAQIGRHIGHVAMLPTKPGDFGRLLAGLRNLRRKRTTAVEGEDPDAELIEAYGPPIFYKSDGSIGSINERFFAARFHAAGNIIYVPAERAFYTYTADTGIWKRDTDDAIREAISAHVGDYGRDIGTSVDSRISVARMNGIVHALRAIAERRDAFSGARNYVHCQNGVIRFPAGGRIVQTGFSREDFSRNRSPIAFDPKANCPRFLNELLRPALPDEDVDCFQKWAGLAITGSNPAQRMMVLDGMPAGGKSTIVKVVQAVVGSENCTQLRTALLTERFEIFRFINKTLLVGPDVQGDFLNRAGASQLKCLVGGDPLSAEAKGANGGFDLVGNFNILITSNSRLRVRLDGDSGAWRRRLIILRFDRPPPAVRIANFAELLVATEGPGILRWALQGLLRARVELHAHGDLQLTASQLARVDALLSESDSIRRFVVERTAHGDGNVTSHELVEAYFHFCASNDWTPQPVRVVERTLADAILEIHCQSRAQDIQRAGKSVRGWRNVILATQSEGAP